MAVIGPNANTASYSGGGSASLPASYTVTPLDAIKTEVEAAGGSVSYTIGVDSTRWTPLLSNFLRSPDGQPGVECRFFQEKYVSLPGILLTSALGLAKQSSRCSRS